jgi:hypothetical protein
MFATRLPARTPRRLPNPVLAMLRRLGGAAMRRHRPSARGARHDAGADLAQRVRESGEW